jgi:hypothetical protein
MKNKFHPPRMLEKKVRSFQKILRGHSPEDYINKTTWTLEVKRENRSKINCAEDCKGGLSKI